MAKLKSPIRWIGQFSPISHRHAESNRCRSLRRSPCPHSAPGCAASLPGCQSWRPAVITWSPDSPLPRGQHLVQRFRRRPQQTTSEPHIPRRPHAGLHPVRAMRNRVQYIHRSSVLLNPRLHRAAESPQSRSFNQPLRPCQPYKFSSIRCRSTDQYLICALQPGMGLNGAVRFQHPYPKRPRMTISCQQYLRRQRLRQTCKWNRRELSGLSQTPGRLIQTDVYPRRPRKSPAPHGLQQLCHSLNRTHIQSNSHDRHNQHGCKQQTALFPPHARQFKQSDHRRECLSNRGLPCSAKVPPLLPRIAPGQLRNEPSGAV